MRPQQCDVHHNVLSGLMDNRGRGKEVMKRTILATFVLAVLAALPARADESFILDIPIRFNANQETGEAKVLLVLSAAPAGAQLVVNGSTTLNLGDTMTVAGDSVSFTTGSGNSVLIDYKPLSNFSG